MTPVQQLGAKRPQPLSLANPSDRYALAFSRARAHVEAMMRGHAVDLRALAVDLAPLPDGACRSLLSGLDHRRRRVVVDQVAAHRARGSATVKVVGSTKRRARR